MDIGSNNHFSIGYDYLELNYPHFGQWKLNPDIELVGYFIESSELTLSAMSLRHQPRTGVMEVQFSH